MANFIEVSERLLYKGWRTLMGKTFQLPNQATKEYEILKTPHIVCVLPQLENGNFLLTKQFRPGPGKMLFVPPGGLCDENENAVSAMNREMAEETGYSGEFIELATTVQDAYATGSRTHFLALNCKKMTLEESEQFKKDPDEFIENIEVSYEELTKLILSGNVSDVETCLLAFAKLGLGLTRGNP
jgi:ADP-ribose pyrophosphatase